MRSAECWRRSSSPACGGGARQDASEPSGNFPVAVATATFPASQRLSEHTHLVLAVRNTGSKTIPNIAVTICNVTCAYPAPAGRGHGRGGVRAGPPADRAGQPVAPGLGRRPAPGRVQRRLPARLDRRQRQPRRRRHRVLEHLGARARWRPGHTAKFDWAVTAVAPGRHVVAWEVAAGLNGKAKAVLQGGGAPAREVHGPDPQRAVRVLRQQQRPDRHDVVERAVGL